MAQRGNWRLRVTPKGFREGGLGSDELDSNWQDGVDLISRGFAWPIGRPAEPPTDALDNLAALLSRSDQIGSRIEGSKQFQLVQNTVFRGGVRQSEVDGHPLHWVQGKTGLRQRIGQILSRELSKDIDLFGITLFATLLYPELHSKNSPAWRKYVYGHEYLRVTTGHQVDKVFAGLISPVSTTDWEEYAVRLVNILADLDDLANRAILHGRLIVGETTKFGDTFVHPEIAGATPLWQLKKRFWFLATSDLPSSIKAGGRPLAARRKEATKLAKLAVKHFESRGLRATAKFIQQYFVNELDLTDNAAKQSWTEAGITRKQNSNPRRNIKVTYQQLKSFFGF